ncbi:hypothetical protein C2S53_005927 [Perilla frutescens var. hirtella]|uniref:Germin-like protein n=1 Tax=Perilla frutescens var. hirtella TaxID=608512 RepID=A0AAD4J1F6_PERFH|nr:hypothetical protein C2S51_021644 [Perilla frutescens var. frutescens]KAH6825440.1 hypothetical protein C2S53_005927 [Perilla frutescens var. hirtella]
MKTSSKQLFLVLAVVSLRSLLVAASDPDPLQDFCVAVNETDAKVYVNGWICKDPTTVKTDDFYYAAAFNVPREIVSPYGVILTPAFVPELPGLNSQGLGLTRIDYIPNGLNPPHTHPRATEVITVLEGTLYAGFMTSVADPNTLFARILYPGDIFVFPRGLLHFQINVGETNASALVAFNSQNPGVVNIPAALFQLEPPLSTEIIAKIFLIDESLAEYLRSRSSF